jgi:hypothetical protein
VHVAAFDLGRIVQARQPGSSFFSHGATAFVAAIDDQGGTRSDLRKLADARHLSFAALAATLRQIFIFR